MKENIFNDFLEGYVNVHNDLVHINSKSVENIKTVEDVDNEIKRLEQIIEANETLVQNSMQLQDIQSGDKEKHKEFETKTKPYMENIKNAEKEIEEVKKQKAVIAEIEKMENIRNSIKKRAEMYKEAQIAKYEEYKYKKEEQLSKAEKDSFGGESQYKVYEYNAKEFKINEKLKEEKEKLSKLEKYDSNAQLETAQEELERIKATSEIRQEIGKLENELKDVRDNRKVAQQEANQQVSQQLKEMDNERRKINRDYIEFLKQIRQIDENPKEVEFKNLNNEEIEINKDNDKDEIDKKDPELEHSKEKIEINENDKNEIIVVGKNKENEDNIELDIEDTNDIEDDLQDMDIDIKRIEKNPTQKINLEDNVGKIVIDEKRGFTYAILKNQVMIRKTEINEIFKNKRNMYKNLNINKMCKEIAGSTIKGLLLSTKVNPAIINSLKNEPETIKEYIQCLKDKKELPFELNHDLRRSSLSIMNRLRMWRYAMAEKDIPGTEVKFTQHFWNRNDTLSEPENKQSNERNMREEVKVENSDNRIEEKAAQTMKEVQEQIAEEVKETINKGEEKE